MIKKFYVQFFDGKEPKDSKPLTEWIQVQIKVDPDEVPTPDELDRLAAIQGLRDGAIKIQPPSAYVTKYDPHAGRPLPVKLLTFGYSPAN